MKGDLNYPMTEQQQYVALALLNSIAGGALIGRIVGAGPDWQCWLDRTIEFLRNPPGGNTVDEVLKELGE